MKLFFEEANGYNTNLKQIFFFLTVLGCLLSVSGIYALASLNVQGRTKEIGIRKVLGSSVAGIIRLLNKDFAIILTVSALIGGSGGYFLTSSLLDNLYVQHLTLGLGIVVLCSVIIFSIGILATSATIFKAATANPTDMLKCE
jgi:putative ABC transport system permease protein